MLKRIAVATSLLVAGISPGLAETFYMGVIKVTAVTPQCRWIGPGFQATSHYHPYIVGQNDQSEGISTVFPFGGNGWQLVGHAFDSVFRTVKSGGLGQGGVFNFPAYQSAQIRLTYRPNITANTETVVLRGQIRRPNNDPGGLNCVATFVGAYVKE